MIFDAVKIPCKDCTHKETCVVHSWVMQEPVNREHFTPAFEITENRAICTTFKYDKEDT